MKRSSRSQGKVKGSQDTRDISGSNNQQTKLISKVIISR